MKHTGSTFKQAVERLARDYNIPLPKGFNNPPSEAERAAAIEYEGLLNLTQQVMQWFQRNYDSNAYAQDYVNQRKWPQDYFREIGGGYAPAAWHDLDKQAETAGWDKEALVGLGFLSKKEGKEEYYDRLRGRIVLPIRSKSGSIVGYTARDITGEAEAKYLNSPETSKIFHKGNNLFGIDTAIRTMSAQRRVYVVEGAVDAMRLDIIGQHNAVAPMGTALTDNQLDILRKWASEIIFIPDTDKPVKEGLPPGTAAVIKNGIKALRGSFTVKVKEIESENGKKEDADSYFTDLNIFNAVEEQSFITWYAAKRFSLVGDKDTEASNAAMREVADILSLVEDEGLEERYIEELAKITSTSQKNWRTALRISRNQQRAAAVKKTSDEIDSSYGFYKKGKCYFRTSDDAQLTNFTIKPLFHIKDLINPKRLYEFCNEHGEPEILELKQAELGSVQTFKVRIEGFGNYIFEGKEQDMTNIKKYLYDKTGSAYEITQLGWQDAGFYAWGNGVYYNGKWIPADEYGIVDIGTRDNYYLPGASKIYANDTKLFQFERKFVHLKYSNVTIQEAAGQMISVFGDNARVGLCFLVATLFRDIIVRHTKSFPILNLFGPKGAGKSELGHSLMSFFIARNTPPNISNATIAAMADAVGQCANAVVHLDEFKNNIDLDKREFLKGLWDGVGRSRMNMDRDKKREITSVSSGVVVSGQEMATADIALFSRFVFLRFSQTEYNEEERHRFNELNKMQSLGFTHLTLEILKLRPVVEGSFIRVFNETLDELSDDLKKYIIEDRIKYNWATLLAAYRCVQDYVGFPFTYADIKPIFVNGIILQNKECKSNNELSQFWSIVHVLRQEHRIWLSGDYRIETVTRLTTSKTTSPIEIPQGTEVLYIRHARLFSLYKEESLRKGEKQILPESSLRFYLENSKEYLGAKKTVRFKDLDRDGKPIQIKCEVGTAVSWKNKDVYDQVLMFDYKKLQENFDINLSEYNEDYAGDEGI
jgi:DNA primase catalytic core